VGASGRAAIALLLAVGMTACGGGGGDPSSPASEPAPVTARAPPTTAALEQSSVETTVQSADIVPVVFVHILVTDFPSGGVWISGQHTDEVIDAVDLGAFGERVVVTVTLRRAGTLGPEVHSGVVSFRVCHDQACQQVIAPSLTATINYTVDIPAGGPPAPSAIRNQLNHDVLDAEFSQALNSIVMVSANPRPALYVYDVADATERELPLNAPPKLVSVSRDGTKAAVAHDSLITYIDLQTLQPGMLPVTRLLGLSVEARDVVLGDRFVYVIPDGTWWVQMHSIEIATNIESAAGQAWPGSRAKLLPNGEYLYAAHNLSPSDVEKWDVRAGVAIRLGDSPYHGEYESCGNLWISEAGSTIYTACGTLFTSTSDPATDMRFIADFDFPLLEGSWFRRVLTLSDSAEKQEVVLVEAPEHPSISCDEVRVFDSECISRLYYYDAVTHLKTGDFSLPPLMVNSHRYPQRGRFLFHDASGGGPYLISVAAGLDDVASSSFVTSLQGAGAGPKLPE
jgi:hypothetical protein